MTELGDYRRLVEKPMIEAHIAELRRKDAEIERLRAAPRAAAQSVLDEFVEDLTSQQRAYIVDQIARRAAAYEQKAGEAK